MMSLLLGVLCCASLVRGISVVDLTHPLNEDTINWPGFPKFNFTILFRGDSGEGFWFEANTFQAADHGGTHLDAPAHFVKDGARTEQVPVERLVGPGVIINVKSKAAADRDYRVRVADLTDWESKYGRIPDGAVVLMNSGWAYKYPVKRLTFGTESVDDPSTFHYPGYHEEAADWLVKNRNVNVVGVDTPSNDYGQSQNFPVHLILGKANICGAEHVANLDSIPESGTVISIGVTKLHDGSGGPARILATFGDTPFQSVSTTSMLILTAILCLLIYIACHSRGLI